MKRILFILSFLAATFVFIGCDDDDTVIGIKELPSNAQTFLQTHFPLQEVKRVEQNNDGYDVYLENGFEIEFTLTGEWDDVNGGGQQIPASIIALIPKSIFEYVSSNYPAQFIVEINKEHYRFEIELNNNIELEFDANGKFIRIS